MLKLKTSKTKNITFTDTIGVAKEYIPKPAVHFIPKWYKAMEPYFPKKITPTATPTIKKCIPVLDAITAGYIIVSPCDVKVTFKNGEPEYDFSILHAIEYHPRKQAYKHPMAVDYSFPKWKNPWAVRTPKGYSCLFIPPMHNPNEFFVILEGIVDTDAYYSPVHFPFVLKKTTNFVIPAGTPIAQVIPFKRDAWIHKLGTDKTDIKKSNFRLNSFFWDRYKRLFWTRKNYQ